MALFGSLPGTAQFFGTDTHELIHLLKFLLSSVSVVLGLHPLYTQIKAHRSAGQKAHGSFAEVAAGLSINSDLGHDPDAL